jgi:hypothetical protein
MHGHFNIKQIYRCFKQHSYTLFPMSSMHITFNSLCLTHYATNTSSVSSIVYKYHLISGVFIIRRCVSSAYSKPDLLYKYISIVIIWKPVLLTYFHAMFITGVLSYSLSTLLIQMLFFQYFIYLSIFICAINLNLHSQYWTSVEALHVSKTHKSFRSCNSRVSYLNAGFT